MSKAEVARAREARILRALAVAISAIYALVVLVVPARGLTFLHDDWTLLHRFVTRPWPERWLTLHNDHFFPVFLGIFDIEWRVFGTHHTLYVIATWVIHVANVALMGRVLERVAGDVRAAAVATVAFGVATSYRDIIWWGECGGMALALTLSLGAFLAVERAVDGSKRALAFVLFAVFVAPLSFDASLALGPALALEAWLLAPKGLSRRLRASIPIAVAWLATVGLALALSPPLSGRGAARSPEDVGAMTVFMARAIGLGVFHENLLVPLSETTLAEGATGAACLFTVIYVLAIAWAASTLDRAGRVRIVTLQVFFLLCFLPMALVRFNWAPRAALFSRHQYLPAVAWLSVGACLARVVIKRKIAQAILALALVALAVAHAREAANDRRESAPGPRRQHVLFVEHLRAAVQGARGPVYDLRLPGWFEGFMVLHASDVVSVLDPAISVNWTLIKTDESIAPYTSDTALAPLVK